MGTPELQAEYGLSPDERAAAHAAARAAVHKHQRAYVHPFLEGVTYRDGFQPRHLAVAEGSGSLVVEKESQGDTTDGAPTPDYPPQEWPGEEQPAGDDMPPHMPGKNQAGYHHYESDAVVAA